VSVFEEDQDLTIFEGSHQHETAVGESVSLGQ